jgi:cytochrome c-type biogenesis protein CcsB
VSTADLAAFSNNAIAFASVIYVLAFLSHLGEWVLGRTVPVDVAEPQPAVVGAKVASSSSGAGAATDLVGSSEATSVEDRSERIELFGRVGISLTVLAAVLHLASLVTRGLGADPARVPWGNMYEFCLTGTFAVTVIYLALLRRYHLRWLGPVVTGFAVVILMLAVLVLYVPAGPLVPALHSYWLVIHVIAAIIATGAFTVGGMASLLFLVKSRAEARGRVRRTGYVARLPQAAVLDRVAYRMHAFGFPIWTFAALVAGPIWAEYAWGRYWGWDPKEVWAFITWVVYAAYLHARATAGWKGRAAAIIALVGLATLLFNFVGINYFFGSTSQHSYAG